MKNKCLIISLKYHAGHWSHIVATYRLFNDLGYDSYLHINTNFLSNVEDCDFNTCNKIGFGDYNRYKLVVVLFPSLKNTWELLKSRIFGSTKLVYLFHEPIGSYLSFYQSGFTKNQLIKLFFVNQFNKFTSYISTIILLPSNKSFLIFKNNYRYLNRNYFLVPLLFDDEIN